MSQVRSLLGAHAQRNFPCGKFLAWARRSDVLRARKTASRGREIFERRRENIRDHKVQSLIFAGVAELVYALVLGTSAARLEGSSPSSSTEKKPNLFGF